MTRAALLICPDCGQEIPTSQAITSRGKMVRLVIPVHVCPVCRASLDPVVRAITRDQVRLPGVS